MHIRPILLALFAALSVPLAGCSTDLAARSQATPVQGAPATEPEMPDRPIKVGQTWRYPDGVTVSVTKLQPGRVPRISAGASPGSPAVTVTVKVTNGYSGSPKRLDLSRLTLDVRVGEDGQAADRVFAGELDNADGTLARGRSYTFQAMFAGSAPFREVAVDVTPSWDHEPALFEGRIR